MFIGFREFNDHDFCKNQSHPHLFAFSYSLCESLELYTKIENENENQHESVNSFLSYRYFTFF